MDLQRNAGGAYKLTLSLVRALVPLVLALCLIGPIDAQSPLSSPTGVVQPSGLTPAVASPVIPVPNLVGTAVGLLQSPAEAPSIAFGPSPASTGSGTGTDTGSTDGQSGSTGGQTDVTSILAGRGEFSTLLTLLTTYNLDTALSQSSGPLTLMAPTNEAFTAVPTSLLTELQAAGQVANILKYHVVQGFYNYSNLSALMSATTVTTLVGASYDIKVVDGRVNVGAYSSPADNANITEPDSYVGSDGLFSLQGINKVLLPPDSNAPGAATPVPGAATPGSAPVLGGVVVEVPLPSAAVDALAPATDGVVTAGTPPAESATPPASSAGPASSSASAWTMFAATLAGLVLAAVSV
eukprot:jgi/Mesen1/7512/ME000039S06730